MEKGVLKKLWSLLQWAIFSFAALGMFAISLVRTEINVQLKAAWQKK